MNRKYKELYAIDEKLEPEYISKLIMCLHEYEEKLNNEKAKTEFFSNMSHEFKTPLNILMGAIQIIELYSLNGAISDPQKKLDKYIPTMKQNAYRLLRLINNIIDLSKIDSSYIDMDVHNHDIVSIIEDIVKSITMYANIKSINITLVKKIESKIIACDIDKIERILLNLLSNALKFSNCNGNVSVVIESVNDMIQISIIDDGIGIPKEKIDVIFQRFRQIDRSFTRNGQGSGIGLTLVKALVDMHEGNIYVDSVYEKGTKFIVQLPDKIVEEDVVNNMIYNDEYRIKERVMLEFSEIE